MDICPFIHAMLYTTTSKGMTGNDLYGYISCPLKSTYGSYSWNQVELCWGRDWYSCHSGSSCST